MRYEKKLKKNELPSTEPKAERTIHLFRVLCETYLCQICHFDIFFSLSLSLSNQATSPTDSVLARAEIFLAHNSIERYFFLDLFTLAGDRLSVIELQLFCLVSFRSHHVVKCARFAT